MTRKSPRSGIPPIIRKPPIAEELDKLREKPPTYLSRATRINPMKLAEMLVERIPGADELERVETSPPGFVNF